MHFTVRLPLDARTFRAPPLSGGRGSETGGDRAAILLSVIASAKLCEVEPWPCSMSRIGCCYTNAVMERFFWSLKHE
jgi:hypothetical protein